MNRVGKPLEERESALTGQPDSPPAYLAPRIIRLGKSKRLIRGAYSSSYADDSHDFYSTGE